VAYVAIIFFEFYIFIHTGTRGALVGLLIGTVVSLGTLFIFSLRDNKRLAFYLGSILFLGVMSMGGLFLTRDTEFVKQYPLLERFADIRTTSSTAQSRFMIWGIAWDAFKERPILGWGPGNFIIPYAKYYNPNLYGNEPWFDRVHNMHLEWLVAGGIIGFLAYISVIGSVLITLWQLWYKHIMSGVAVVTLLGFLVAYLGQNTFVFDNVVTYIFFTLLLALVQSLYTPVPKEEEHSVQKQSRVLVIAPVFIVLGVTASITHVQQMQVAGGIIDMLNSVGTGNTVHSMTRQLDDLKEKNTFGTTEVRERFVDFLFAATRPSAEIPASDLLFLLSRGIEEMNEEIARSPENTKHRISLGKLLQLRFSLTRNEADYDEAVRVYEETIQQAPHFPPAYIGLAEVYLTVGNTARAMDFMDTIFNEMTRPSQLFVHSLLLVDVLSGDYDGGVAHIERYLSLGNTQSYPRDATFDHTRTTDLIQRVEAVGGDARSREGFLEAYQPGLAGWRDHEVFLRSLANIKAELGKKEEARELAQMIITANPDRGPEVEVFLRSLDAL
jgi:tetratricopeptide (TPR) repeat protein